MSETPKNSPEKKETLDDNARKFITEPLDQEFLEKHGATSFTLTVDWLETGKDNETKVAYKKFDNGDVQILFISKITIDGNRTSEKEKITKERYKELLTRSKLHLEKKRYEFEHVQNGIPFSVKYDKFADDKPAMLEIDAPSEAVRDSFDANDFPYALAEVTGDTRYYGFRVAETIQI